MRAWRLEVRAGGDPGPARTAALASAVAALVDHEGRPVAEPTPAAYRSRWRRAALIESSEVPTHLKDDRTVWAGGN